MSYVFKVKTVPALVNIAMAGLGCTLLGFSTAALTVEAHLVQVLLYEPGGHLKKHRNVKNEGNYFNFHLIFKIINYTFEYFFFQRLVRNNATPNTVFRPAE